METKQNDFASQVAADAAAQAHAQEIKQTRVGGLGGSDAALVLRVATKGLAGLTATDLKRLCVMCGTYVQEDFGCNAYTNAGHAFEDYAEKNLPWGIADNTPKNYQRELVMSQKLALNFKTFAHADFAVIDGNDTHVIECKFVQQNSAKVVSKYYAQLQWYYMLGAKSVQLCHGTGNVEPFEVLECSLEKVERDEETINLLLQGVKIIDDALTSGWRPEPLEKEVLSNTPEVIQKAFAELEEVKTIEVELKARKDAAAGTLKQYLEDWGFTGILQEGTKHQVIYTKGGISKSFDAAAFLKDHPEYHEHPEYWKTTNRASSVTFK